MSALRSMIAPAFVVALCATAAAQDEKCQSASAGYYATAGLPDYDHDRFGTSTDEGDFRIDFQGFISSFDGSDDDTGDGASDLLMLPEWVAYEMRFFGDVTAGFKLAPGWARPSPWYEHEDLVADRPGQELLDESYKGEAHIWNRGHLATRSHINRLGPEYGCNSHVLFNAVPQYWAMNQGDWLALERYLDALANQMGAIWIVTGPVFVEGQEIETIGEAGEIPVAIPHALFKVVAIEDEEGVFDARGFLFIQPTYAEIKQMLKGTGEKVPPPLGFRLCRSTPQENYDLSAFAVPIEQIEAITGIQFFRELGEDERLAMRSSQQGDLWAVDDAFFPQKCGGDGSD